MMAFTHFSNKVNEWQALLWAIHYLKAILPPQLIHTILSQCCSFRNRRGKNNFQSIPNSLKVTHKVKDKICRTDRGKQSWLSRSVHLANQRAQRQHFGSQMFGNRTRVHLRRLFWSMTFVRDLRGHDRFTVHFVNIKRFSIFLMDFYTVGL